MTQPTSAHHITVLAGQRPIAHGAVRDVWNRPGHPDQILKTIRAEKRTKYAKRGALHRMIDHLRLGPYRTFHLEYRAYLNTAYKCSILQLPLPIAEVGSLVMTDCGLAQVNEKITDQSGGLAKTLDKLIKQGKFDDKHLRWFNEFIQTLFTLNVNAPDLTPVNIVADEEKERFVLIDGYGDKTIFPLRAWSKYLNQKNLEAQIINYEKFGLLKWDTQTKSFSWLKDASE